MATVFISHSNQDNDLTLHIVEQLRQAGYGVWVDFESIRGGADWLCEIEAGIARCDAVVVILSQASAKSVWVERECLYAFQLRTPVITALVEDVLIPLQLINLQYCDLREATAAGMATLVESLRSLQRPAEGWAAYPTAMTSQPIEANFFPYLEQLPAGDLVRMVAQDLFSWARQFADELAFGGRSNPGFHIRINVDGKLVTICSIRAYRMTPSAQLPLDYLAAHKPYDKRVKRRATLRKLNRLLPKDARFAVAKADKRPAIPLTYLSSAEKLDAFKLIVLEIVGALRGTGNIP